MMLRQSADVKQTLLIFPSHLYPSSDFQQPQRTETAETFTSLGNSAESDRKFKSSSRKVSSWVVMAQLHKPCHSKDTSGA